MDEAERAGNQKQLVATIVMASGAALVLAGIALLAIGGRPVIGAALAAVGAMDLGVGVYLRTRQL